MELRITISYKKFLTKKVGKLKKILNMDSLEKKWLPVLIKKVSFVVVLFVYNFFQDLPKG